MKHFGVAAVAAIVVLGTAGALTYQHWPQAAKVEVLGKPTLEPQIMAYGKNSQDAPPSLATPSSRPAALRPKTIPALHPGDPVFDRLVASKEYADHRKAYDMTKQCVVESATQVRSIAHPCTLSPGKWGDVETRRRLLTECAEVGDGYCWVDSLMAGPGGMYEVFTDPEEHQALVQRAYTAAVAKADPFALTSEAVGLQKEAAETESASEKRALLTRAWAYQVAAAAGLALLNEQTFDPATNLTLKVQKASHYAQLSPAEIQAATTDGLKLAETFKRSRS